MCGFRPNIQAFATLQDLKVTSHIFVRKNKMPQAEFKLNVKFLLYGYVYMRNYTIHNLLVG